jgi:hypothetical protein
MIPDAVAYPERGQVRPTFMSQPAARRRGLRRLVPMRAQPYASTSSADLLRRSRVKFWRQ